MTGKAYYLTTIGTWRRHAARFANAHFVVLDAGLHPVDIADVQQGASKTNATAEITDSDLDALRRMHASQGFDYPFPDLADPIFVSRLILEDDSGRAVMASLARLTCEMYLLADGEAGRPRDRLTRLEALHNAGRHDLFARGLDDAHAWLPPQIAKRFGRRLQSLGWIRDDTWTPYCHPLRDRR
jgi:hypothetical protein